MARFIKSEHALQVCLKAGLSVFRAVKNSFLEIGCTYTYQLIKTQKGYLVVADKAQLQELGISSNATNSRTIVGYSETTTGNKVRSFKDWAKCAWAHECAWAEERIEVESVETGETDVGGNPIAGHFVRHDNGQEIGRWGVDGERLLFPDGTVVEFI